MGGKVSSYKNKSFNWTRQRKKRSALFTRFLSVLLYTKNHDLIPNSILLDDIPFPTRENFQSNFIIPRRPLSPVSFYSDYSLDIYDNLDILDDINNDIISFEKVDELLIRFQLQKDKFGMFSKGKNKSVSNIWIWKKSNRDSGIGEISVINFEN
ncbi:19016_t:CDS:2 [Rhizophagus irregularis]|nr:19016_t:CDS:2 [Rhizophagus irregularis]